MRNDKENIIVEKSFQFSLKIVDFIHKMKIASKEADETEYWLLICKFSPSYPFEENILDFYFSN